MSLQFKNDSKRLSSEFSKLRSENNELWEMVLNDLVPWVDYKFDKELVVTMIYRTQAEQDAIYKGYVKSDGRKYKDDPWKSPHQFYHAVDLRSRNFTANEIKEIENYLNSRYDGINYYRWTAKDHTVGKGEHLHLQFIRG